MRYIIGILTFILFVTPSFAAGNKSPGAIKTLSAIKEFLSYAVPFQKEFDDLCGPIYEKAAHLTGSERRTYLYKADLELAKRLSEDDRVVQCRGNRGYFRDIDGRDGSVEDGQTRMVSFRFADNEGLGQIVYDQKRVTYNYYGRKLVFSFDPGNVKKSHILRVNIPDFAKACFARLVKGTSSEGMDGMLPTNKQKEILEQVYWYVAEMENAPSFFTFYGDLLKKPQIASRQILALHDRYLATQKAKASKETGSN